MSHRLVHFEIHADEPERAAKFYTTVFGWDIKLWEPSVDVNFPMKYWVIMTGDKDMPGINGGMIKRMGPPPADGAAVNAYVCTMMVDDIDAAIKRVTDSGGSIALPKMAIKGMMWLVYCKDTEGNIFGIGQDDPNAT